MSFYNFRSNAKGILKLFRQEIDNIWKFKLALSDQSLGLVINCNNTRRYYDKNDFEGVGICYKEVTCPGRGFLYRTDIVKLFIKTIDEFLTNNGDNG